MSIDIKHRILGLRARAISIIVVFTMIFGVLTIVDVPKNVKAEDYNWTITSYNWMDISSTGTVIWQNTSVNDGYAGPFSIGFNFTFYDNPYNQLYVGSNGYITFGYGTGVIPYDFPPSGGSPDNSIMPFGYDMYVRIGITTVYYEQVTSPQRFIIQYNQLDYYGNASGNYQTFQIILYTNGDIITQYQTVDLDGSDPYVGIENSNGTAGVSYTAALNNNLAIKYSFTKYEHDIAVENLQAPDYLEPGEYTYINATIRNVGLNNETNILVNFTVDGVIEDNTTIPFLETGNSTIISFPWTPTAEGNYTVGIEAAPVPDENYTGNNQQYKVVKVRYCKGFVLFDQTHGTDSISLYSDWVDSLVGEGYIVDTHTAGVIDPSIFNGYDVFVIPQAQYTYTTDEHSAIQDFVSSGGGLLVIGDDEPYIYSDLTGFSGINWTSGGTSGTTTDITPHEITTGVSSVYLGAPVAEMLISGSAIDLVRDTIGNIMLAVSEDPGRVAGFADEGSLWNGGINQADNLLLANNIIEWLVGIEYEHDIAVTNFQAPDYLEPGESTLVNATIRNAGLNNETNILVNFTVDGVVMDNTTISFLETGNTTFVTFPWTPTVEGNYTVGIEAAPVPDENYTGNNQQSKIVRVGFLIIVAIFDHASTGDISYWTGGNGNSYVEYENVILSDPESRFVSTIITDLALSTLSTVDVLLLPDNAVPDIYLSDVDTWFVQGKGIVCVDSATCYAAYSGYMFPGSAGSNGYGTYWDYNSGFNNQEVLQYHEITEDYSVGSILSSISSDAELFASMMPTDALGLTAKSLDHNSIYVAARDVPSQGRIVVLGPYQQPPLGCEELIRDAIEWAVMPPPEHDITVTNLQAPDYLEPDESTFVNASIRNAGLNNETNILINFTVDGVVMDSTTISFLETGNSTIITFPWTPTAEGNYTVGIEAAPVPDENYTGNNQQYKVVKVRYYKGFVLFDQTHGTDSILSYSDWVDSLVGEGYIVNTYTAGVIDPSIFNGYDVFVIPQAYSTYTTDEHSAIQDFVSSGGGLLVIGDNEPYIYSDLTGFSSINWTSGGTSGTTTDITPHEITTGVSSVYLSSPMSEMTVSGSAIDLVRDPVGDIMLAVSEDPGRVAGFADENSLRNSGINQADNLLLANNIIEWLVGIKYEHDIAVTNFQAPDYLEPGGSTYVNATIRNIGLNNETNILVNFTVDGVVMDSTTISFLETGNTTFVTFPWTPTVEGNYTVGIEAALVPDENYTGNNQQSKIVRVRYCKGFVLFDQTHGTDDISSYSDWVGSLMGEGYIVDTHTAGTIDPSIFNGYDVFVIPQAHSTYTRDEISAIQSFVSSGGGLFVIGDDNPILYSYLTGFAGIYWDYWWWNGSTTDITPHEITAGVSSVYLNSPETKIMLSGSATDLVRDTIGNIMLAVSEDPGRVVGFSDERSLWNWGINQADNLLLANNIIEWLSGDISPPTITGITAVPDPQEVYGYANISAIISDNVNVDTAWINITDPNGNTMGNFSLTYDSVAGRYHKNQTYDIVGTYQFIIWANDTSNNWNFSVGQFTMQDTMPPTTPTGLIVADVPSDEGGALDITWNVNTEPDLDHYTLYSNKTGSWAVVAEIPAGTEYYIDTGLTDGTRYYYNISASDGVPNESPQSAMASGVPTDNPPAAPTGLTAQDHPNDEGGAIDLNWNDNTETDLNHYDVYRSTTSGGPYTWLTETTLSEYTDSTTTDGVTCYYVVTASDEVPNESGYSNEASANSLDNQPQGTISGVVKDKDGNPIEGATVTIYTDGTTTNPVITATTNSNGVYSVDVAPGTYDIKIEKSGYETQWIQDVEVTADQTTTADATLPLKADILDDYWWLILLIIIVIIILIAVMILKKKGTPTEAEETEVETEETIGQQLPQEEEQ